MTAAGACDAGLMLAAGHSRRWGEGDKLLADWRGGAEYEAMRRIKAALDPQGIMNPGAGLG